MECFFSDLQPFVVLSRLTDAAIKWWGRGNSKRKTISPILHQAESILISDDESIEKESTVESDQLTECSTIPIKKCFQRKRTRIRKVTSSKLYFCDCCVYETTRRSHFNRHCKSETHRRNERIYCATSGEESEKDSRWLFRQTFRNKFSDLCFLRSDASSEKSEQRQTSNHKKQCEVQSSHAAIKFF